MKLWEKGINPEPAIIEFTAGKDRKTDLALTKWDIIGSMAHVIMLEDVGLVSEDEKNDLLKALHSFLYGMRKGAWLLKMMWKIFILRSRRRCLQYLGPTGKKIHTGRSRNDQVLVDITSLYTGRRLISFPF